MSSTLQGKWRLTTWDNRILDTLANGTLAETRFIGKALGLTSYLALGAVCYPLYAVFFLLWPEGRTLIGQVVIADLMGLAVLVGLRYAMRRQRPHGRRYHRYIIPWNRYSFPSGHAVRAFAIAVTLTSSGPAWCVVTLPIACVVALSRITLARHYPSDVLAGMAIGSLAGLVCTTSL